MSNTQPPAETLAIIEMLQSAEVQEGITVFDHSAEEIGIAVMENHRAIFSALTRRAGGDAGTVATIADLQRRRASDLDAVVNLSLCLKEARDALEWYRDTVGRCRMMHAEGDEARNALHKDCGERAEKALAFRVPAREPKHDQ